MADDPVLLHVDMTLGPDGVAGWNEARQHLEPAHEANGLRFRGAYRPVYGQRGRVTALYEMDDAAAYARAGVELRKDEDYVRWGTAVHDMIRDEHVSVVRPLTGAPAASPPGQLYVRVTVQIGFDNLPAYLEARGHLADKQEERGLHLHAVLAPLFGRVGSVVVLYAVADAGTLERATAELVQDPEYVEWGSRIHGMIEEETVELVRAL